MRSEDQVADEANRHPRPGSEETDRASSLDQANRQGHATQLESIERDLDTVDAALSALDADDLETAVELASELEEPQAGNPA